MRRKRTMFAAVILVAAVFLCMGCKQPGGIEDSSSTGDTTPVITIDVHPAETTTVTEGSITGSLSVQASVTEGAALSYQWFDSAVSDSNNSYLRREIDGATNAQFTIPTTLTADGLSADTYYYFCEVRTTNGGNAKRSNVAAVIVNPDNSITITEQPENLTVTTGMITEYLSVTAELTPEYTTSINLSYQWYSNTSAGNTGGTKLDGETSVSFILPSGLTIGKYYYFCEVSVGALSVRSNAATVTVGESAEIVMRLTTITEVDVITQTASAKANTDKPFTISGTDYTAYQWYVDGASVGTSSTYTFKRSAGVYELAVVVTDTAGRKYSGSCRVTVR